MGIDQDTQFMQQAIEQAKRAEQLGEVPVGAVLVLNDEVIATGHNQPIADHDPTAHAEIITLRKAGEALKNYRLPNTTLYVTLEPCAMCAAAMIHARIHRLVFGATDPKAGAIVSTMRLLDVPTFNHKIQTTQSPLAEPCGNLLKNFFKQKR